MGKAQRLKRDRAVELAANPHPQLAGAVKIIGYAYGAHADCAGVSALLNLTAGNLGYELTPRAVSALIRQPSNNNVFFMGPRATALVPDAERHRLENSLPGGRDTGHMVLTSKEPLMLFDANLGQLRRYGMAAPDSVAFPIAATQPDDGTWRFDLPDLEITYLPDNNNALWDRYEAGLIQHADEAAQLAELLRRGVPITTIMGSVTPRI